MSADAFRVQIWDPSDESVVDEFLEAGTRVDGRPDLGAEWFLWKFRSSPWGHATVAYARDRQSGKVAGLVAFGCWRLLHAGQSVPAGVSYETFVLPEFQRRGLFNLLSQRAQEDMRGRGARVLFNFPNPTSRPGFLKLGWVDLGGMESWFKPLRPFRVAAWGLRGKGRVPPPTAQSIINFDPPGPEWFERHTASYQNRKGWAADWSGDRDPAILAWRYRTFRMFRYLLVEEGEMAGVARVAERSGLREVQIMEFFYGMRPSVGELRRLVAAFARESEADVATATLSRGHPLRPLLLRAGFLPIRNHVSFFALRLDPSLSTLEGTQNDWAISGGEIHMM